MRAFRNGLAILLVYSLFSLIGILAGGVLTILKLFGLLDWSWWWVAVCFAPVVVGITTIKLLEFFGKGKP